VKRISDEDLKTWCIRAYEVLIRQTDRPGAMAFRRVLISIKARRNAIAPGRSVCL